VPSDVDPFSRRSFTSFVTNTTVLPAIQLRRHLPAIVKGELPAECLLPFLHEATHNWCFLTPVGSAAAALALRARRRAAALVFADVPSDEAFWAMLDDHVRATYVLRALHPLNEGLALFAEHEVVPEQSSHLSPVMQSALAYFQRDAVRREGVADAVLRLLAGGRGSSDGIRRKATLLEQPLWTGGIRGGYLAGYLTVKNLWIATLHSCKRFGDTDLFLEYLKTWFFDDWGLVWHLLDDQTKDIAATDRIGEYIVGRFNALASADHEDSADRLEERGRWVPPTGPERLAIGVTPEVEAAARQRLDAIITELTELTEPADDNELMRAAAELARGVFSRRPLLLLGRLCVDVYVDSGDVTLLSADRPLLSLPPAYGLKPTDGHGNGVLEVFAAPVSRVKPIVFVVWREGRLVGMNVTHGRDLASAGTSLPVVSVQVIEKAGAALQSALSWVLGERDTMDIVRIVLDALEEEQFETLSQTALHLAHADRVDGLREHMREFGFLPVVGGADAVWTLAFLSVMTKLPMPREILRELYRSLGGPPGQLEKAFDAVQAATRDAFGVPLVSGDLDAFVALV
jgi:hypothetical protein